jgi:hypothetical protein
MTPEEKIAVLKANFDLAIEGRDIKIKELELELTVEKDLHQEETNLHLHAEEYIKSLEQKLEQTEKDLADYQFNYPKIKELEKENAELKEELKNWKDEWQEQVQKAIDEGYARTQQTIQLTKATELIEDMYDKIPASHSDYYRDVMERARQFLKDLEK